MPLRLRKSDISASGAVIASASVIVTVAMNAFAAFACCERTNGDGREVRFSVRVSHLPSVADVRFETQCS